MLVGVNQTGLEGGLPDMPAPLPVLQSTTATDVWALWGAKWRDIVIVDPKGNKASVFSVIDHDLGQPDNRAALKAALLEAAKR